jgi:predicted MFS family arabinose efflux permease
MGALESLNSLCVAIGLPLGGLLVALSSPRAAFVVIGLGLVVTSVILLLVSRGGPEEPLSAEAHSPLVASPPSVLRELPPDGAPDPSERPLGDGGFGDTPAASGATEEP